MNSEQIKSLALQTISLEAEAVRHLAQYVNENFLQAVQWIHESKGRLIICGIGKSAIIAQKIVATMNSTGTPALFLHAADAIHGDLGMMQADDIALLISKSGESAEIKVLIPLIKNFGNRILALCGNAQSSLALQADVFINTTVSQEACPNNLAPTSSTTAQLVMGDALAVCLLELKGFTPSDFAKFHPGGALGKQLYTRVSDLSKLNAKPSVLANAGMKETIVAISTHRLGAVAVLNESNKLLGIITDGDIRRMLEVHSDLSTLCASNIMNDQPKTIDAQALAVDALSMMRKFNIGQLVVLEENRYAGMLHIQDLVREGII